MKKYQIASVFERFDRERNLNRYVANGEKQAPIIGLISETTMNVLVAIWTDFDFNEESMRAFLKKLKNWKKVYPDLTYYQIVYKISKGEKLKPVINWGKLKRKN